jgi:hypothetical protein
MISARRPFLLLLALLAGVLATSSPAGAAGGDYVFDGGGPAARAEVRAALDASAFDWGLVPTQVTIHLVRGVHPHSLPAHIYLDPGLLRAGRFAWAVVQDEYAHQVDFFLFDDALRARLTRLLGGRAWCRSVPGLSHAEYGCERFASTLVWSYWPSARNAYRPESASDESASMHPGRFRALMAQLLAK